MTSYQKFAISYFQDEDGIREMRITAEKSNHL